MHWVDHAAISQAMPVIELQAEVKLLLDQRDTLLAALRNLLAEGEFTDYPNTTQWYAVQAARAAIEKAEKVC